MRQRISKLLVYAIVISAIALALAFAYLKTGSI